MSQHKIKKLITQFSNHLTEYKNASKYNEHSCRIEYIEPLLEILGWDVANKQAVAPQLREVIAEQYSENKDRPDYSLTLRGVTKFFVEVKKPSIDITVDPKASLQARKYGWNAKHPIVILTNFEYLIIYDTTIMPEENDGAIVARHKVYKYTQYNEFIDEIKTCMSKNSVYDGTFDVFWGSTLSVKQREQYQVDTLFLRQINKWRIDLSNELYTQKSKYNSLEILNDVVQEFINQIIFLRICEDKKLPLYHTLKETIQDENALHNEFETLIKESDKKYNSGLFSASSIIFDLKSATISEIIKTLYYPQSPYLFNIIEPNLLGKIYELFLAEHLVLNSRNKIELTKKKDCVNKAIVTTPSEIVKYMVEKALSPICFGKTPDDILKLKIADIACGSGIFLEAVFDYLHTYCVNWYISHNETSKLTNIGNGNYKLPIEEKKKILLSCIYGVDIDIHAVEVAKFSLLIKLIENETAPTISKDTHILPTLESNIFHGNALVNSEGLSALNPTKEDIEEIVPFDWNISNEAAVFDVIIGNPPYVKTEDLLRITPQKEIEAYKKQFKSVHKQFDKYFLFVEQALEKLTENGRVCYIIPNKFFKVSAGKKICRIISDNKYLVSIDDFGATQLFDEKTIYSSIILLEKNEHTNFTYNKVTSLNDLLLEKNQQLATFKLEYLLSHPWRLSTELDFIKFIEKLDKICVPLSQHTEIFNGIQTSAETPMPVYWFSQSDIVKESPKEVTIIKKGKQYTLEKRILKPYFKPVKQKEKKLSSYSNLPQTKWIIFPYDANGHLIPLAVMKKDFPQTYNYLSSFYIRLVPKSLDSEGTRDVPNATKDTWYQYGRTQALTAFINTPKLIVGILSKEPMYIFDNKDTLIASGGTAGYCAISTLPNSQYSLEYIQAWLTHPITEKIIRLSGSDFEGDFVSRGTAVLSKTPFIELDFSNVAEKQIYDEVVLATQNIYKINTELEMNIHKAKKSVLRTRKTTLISKIEKHIQTIYDTKVK